MLCCVCLCKDFFSMSGMFDFIFLYFCSPILNIANNSASMSSLILLIKDSISLKLRQYELFLKTSSLNFSASGFLLDSLA